METKVGEGEDQGGGKRIPKSRAKSTDYSGTTRGAFKESKRGI